MKKLKLLFFLILFIICGCKGKTINFKYESWFFYRLPLDSDLYFKLKIKDILKLKNISNLTRIKEAISFFKQYSVNLVSEVDTIYGGVYLFKKSHNNVYIVQGNFNINRIKNKLKRTHKEIFREGYIYYKSRNPKLLSLTVIDENCLILSKTNRMNVYTFMTKRVFNTLNIFKRVEINSDGWLLLYNRKKLKEYFRKHIEVEIFSKISFFSVSYKYDIREKSFEFRIENYIKDKTLFQEIKNTYNAYYSKIIRTYDFVHKFLYNYKCYVSDNFVKIIGYIDLSKLKLESS